MSDAEGATTNASNAVTPIVKKARSIKRPLARVPLGMLMVGCCKKTREQTIRLYTVTSVAHRYMLLVKIYLMMFMIT